MRKKDDEKEKSIKEAVIKLILEEGFHGTSISKIAKAAGVSPATVYIYFENKEIMLQDIYNEYSGEIFSSLLENVHKGMKGDLLIEMLIRSYYGYISEHKEIFSFVEQFSNCPSLANSCSENKNICNIDKMLSEMKDNKMIKEFSNDNLKAFIFYPVKSIAADTQKSDSERAELLQEMIRMVQDALLL